MQWMVVIKNIKNTNIKITFRYSKKMQSIVKNYPIQMIVPLGMTKCLDSFFETV